MLAFIDPETLSPATHPLRTIKRFADAALLELSPLFDEMYAAEGQGRASIRPERWHGRRARDPDTRGCGLSSVRHREPAATQLICVERWICPWRGARVRLCVWSR